MFSWHREDTMLGTFKSSAEAVRLARLLRTARKWYPQSHILLFGSKFNHCEVIMCA
jgi:hypothetical protein